MREHDLLYGRFKDCSKEWKNTQISIQEKWLNRNHLYKAIIPPPNYDKLNSALSRVE